MTENRVHRRDDEKKRLEDNVCTNVTHASVPRHPDSMASSSRGGKSKTDLILSSSSSSCLQIPWSSVDKGSLRDCRKGPLVLPAITVCVHVLFLDRIRVPRFRSSPLEMFGKNMPVKRSITRRSADPLSHTHTANRQSNGRLTKRHTRHNERVN